MKLRKIWLKKFSVLTTVLAMSMFSLTANAATIGTDSVSGSVYGTVATGSLVVNDTNAYSITSYSRSGSNISVTAYIYAVERHSGSNHQLDDYEITSGGGATAQVELNITSYPNAVFMDVTGQHEVQYLVNGALLESGHWLDTTYWER